MPKTNQKELTIKKLRLAWVITPTLFTCQEIRPKSQAQVHLLPVIPLMSIANIITLHFSDPRHRPPIVHFDKYYDKELTVPAIPMSPGLYARHISLFQSDAAYPNNLAEM